MLVYLAIRKSELVSIQFSSKPSRIYLYLLNLESLK